jgi:hypothetical protein
MKHWMSLAFLFAFLPSVWASPTTQNVFEETLYHSYQKDILSGQQSFQGFTPTEQSLYVDALWDLADEGETSAIRALDEVSPVFLDLTEKLRVGILRIKYNRAKVLPEELLLDLTNALRQPVAETKLIYTLAAYESDILKAGHTDLIELAKTHKQYFDIADDEARKKEITDDIIADIFHKTPDVTTYMNGEYVKSVKIYKFCRENRLYPCLMVMRDIHGEVVRNEDGSIWTHQSLASSAKGLPSYTRNGNTPAGIMTIDSVMPIADQQISFGKFRRMMLNFIPKSKDEVLLKSLMPESSQNQEWWKTTITARDIGRNLFRIHGTGKINQDPSTPYFPFMRTSGCIAQRENTYNGITYKDQRDLLDAIMKAMDLEPSFDNEVKVKGILYIVEIDDKNDPVSAEDLALRGIE